MSEQIDRRLLLGAAGLAGVAAFSKLARAGDLDPPPGPITPTMKPLDQIEPRTAISLTNTPGDANSLFKITQPGSYYLTGNIAGVSGKHGIEIAASNVSLDLTGFALIGVSGSLDGITVETGPRTNITIRNGSVSGWSGDGIELGPNGVVTGALVEGVHASGNAVRGIAAGNNAIVRDCTANQNGNSGISVSRNGVVDRCVALDNATIGIICGNASSITHCLSQDNGADGFFGNIGCTINACSAFNNRSDGIVVGTGSVVTGCVANENIAVGIIASSGSLVHANACRANGTGIQTSGADSRLERNNCVFNTTGFSVPGSGNFIVANTCSGSTTNWNIATGNVCVVIQATTSIAILGNAGGVSPGSSNPNTNYTF